MIHKRPLTQNDTTETKSAICQAQPRGTPRLALQSNGCTEAVQRGYRMCFGVFWAFALLAVAHFGASRHRRHCVIAAQLVTL